MDRRWQPRPIRVPDVGPTINTTPLIDLMLVLLVMLIISIPIATHKMPLDVQAGGEMGVPPPVHRLDVDAVGIIAWDGVRIADSEAAVRLRRMAVDPAEPVLHFAADGEARYERIDEILAVVLRSGITRLGLVGNERFYSSLDRDER